jgi:hypothetical protein
MTDDLVKRLRVLDPVHHLPVTFSQYCYAAADRIEFLECALRSIAETPIGAEIPDRTTIWGLAVYMQETAKDALKEGDK